MFKHLMEERVPEESGDTLWSQCLQALSQHTKPVIDLDEVERLVLLVSKDLRGEFVEKVKEVASDPINGFQPDLPWR